MGGLVADFALPKAACSAPSPTTLGLPLHWHPLRASSEVVLAGVLPLLVHLHLAVQVTVCSEACCAHAAWAGSQLAGNLLREACGEAGGSACYRHPLVGLCLLRPCFKREM